MKITPSWLLQAVAGTILGIGNQHLWAQTPITVVNNGPSADTFDIMVLGDGYTQAEMPLFRANVDTIVSELFQEEPFREYAPYFNVHRLETPSSESGASHPENTPPLSKNTAFSAAYNCGGVARLVCVDQVKVRAALNSVSASMMDTVFILVNDQTFGGSGGALTVTANKPGFVETLKHELGHTIGRLADEYDSQPPACDDVIEPSQPNVTKQTSRLLLKWGLWISGDTDIPTSCDIPSVCLANDIPGLYKGARYCPDTLFRPTYRSKMRELHRPFGAINTEQLTLSFYNRVHPIVSVSPDASNVSVRKGEPLTFSVQTRSPASHNLISTWYVDGALKGDAHDFVLDSNTLDVGNHDIDLHVQDPTEMVKNDPGGNLQQAATWNVLVQSACSGSYVINPTSASVGSGGTGGSVSVSAATDCSWFAVSNASWLTISSGTSGAGNGTVVFQAAPNSASTSRTGTVTIAGLTFTVTQAAGQSCSYSINPTSASVGNGGTGGSVSVSAASGCSWTAVSNAGWLTISSGTSGTGSGTVVFQAAPNSASTSRTGTMTIAGLTFTVTQAAGQSCSYSINPTSASVGNGGTGGSVSVSAASGCSWTAVSNASWLTISSGTSGTGNGTVVFQAAPNSASTPRTGTVTIAGLTFTVTQAAGQSCNSSIMPTAANAPSSATSGIVAVTAATGCSWTAVSNVSWLIITSGRTGTGNGTVLFQVSSNPSDSIRVGTMTIAGLTFTVTQAGGQSCNYSITPTSASVGSGGTGGSVSVSAASGCSWTAVSNASWVTVNAGNSGSGNGTVVFQVAPNPTGSSRFGTIAIAGLTFTITQGGSGQSCSYSVFPTDNSYGPTGGVGNALVTTTSNCPWTAASNASWITNVSPSSGTGSGGVAYSVQQNNSGSSRIGTITIAGQTVTVSQSALTTQAR